MKKHLIILGIAVLLICVGLSGCFEDEIKSTDMTVEEIKGNSINVDILKKARKYDVNISSFLEVRLREYIALIEGKSIINTHPERQNSARKTKNEERTCRDLNLIY